MAILETDGLSMRFGGLMALRDVSVRVGEYEIVGMIGPNGAGKTTFFNCVTGVHRTPLGRVHFRGRDITDLPAHRRAALGIGRTFQNVGLVQTETVLTNLLSAQHTAITYGAVPGMVGSPGSVAAERQLRQRAGTLLELLDIAHLRDAPVRGLPYGTLKRVEIAAALATDPDLLLLDEPSSGMGPDEAHRLGGELLALREQLDLTILMIEHHVPLVARVCDHVYVLNFGELLAEGRPEQVQEHPEVIAAYLGADQVAEAATEPGEAWP